MRGVVLGLVLVLLPAVAGAQAPPPPAPLDPWESYHLAFLRLARGDRDGARTLLSELAATHPDHPAATFARSRLDEIGEPRIDTGPIDPLREERPTRGARAEIVLGQTLHAVFISAEVCIIAGCEGERAAAAASLVGVGGGLAGSLYFTRDGITAGHADSLNSGYIWGGVNALMILDNLDEETDRQVALSLLGGQLAGMAAGEIVHRLWHPTAGQVAAANTAGFWTGILVILGQAAVEMDFSTETVILSADAGIAVGGFLSSRYPISRGRTYLIDTGGIVGMLAGALIAVGSDDEQTAFTSLFIGTAAGLTGGILLTRDWDAAPEIPDAPRVAITPIQGGWGATISLPLP